MARYDACSAGNINEVDLTHADILWHIDFDAKLIKGAVTYTVTALVDGAKSLVLDGKDLAVDSAADVTDLEKKLQHGQKPSHYEPFGQVHTVSFEQPLKKGETRKIRISYSTSPSAMALQWMNAEQTNDKKYKFMYSQCQAIYARTILPCQDTPSVKFTYSASVTAPSPATVLMSAVIDDARKKNNGDGTTTHHFEQKVAIPSYLLAIVAGALEKREMSPRCAVYAEPSVVDKAKWEFEATDSMLSAAEDLLGPYVWGRYDLLVLPNTFPFGGMENPCLTFVTPTLLAGDRSLVNVIAHEIAHSWTGNLVTNSNWQHFWLNEGNTVFVERKIIGRLDGDAARSFGAYSGYHTDLYSTIYEQFKPDHPFTKLVLDDMKEVDPEDAYSRVAYEKGSAMLMCLEQRLGGEDKFNAFLRQYIDAFKYKTVDTHTWKAFLEKHFAHEISAGALDDFDWSQWLYGVGMPPCAPKFNMTNVQPCLDLIEQWKSKPTTVADEAPFTKLDANQRAYILAALANLDPPVPASTIEHMSKVYPKLHADHNPELELNYMLMGVRARFEPFLERAIAFATAHGRMKFCRPMFRALYAWEKARPLAVAAFKKQRPFMHDITASTISKDLKLV